MDRNLNSPEEPGHVHVETETSQPIETPTAPNLPKNVAPVAPVTPEEEGRATIEKPVVQPAPKTQNPPAEIIANEPLAPNEEATKNRVAHALRRDVSDLEEASQLTEATSID